METKRSLIDRMKGAAFLDVEVYEEVEADSTATGQAALVVAIVAACGALGASVSGIEALPFALIGAFASWLVWTVVTFFVGTRVFGGNATWDQLLRTLAFAQAPGVLNIFSGIPLLGALIWFGVSIWQVATCVVAIRQALDFDTSKAVLTAIIAIAAIFLVIVVPFTLLGLGGLGLMAMLGN